MGEKLDYGWFDAYTHGGNSILETTQPTKFAIGVRTRLAVTVYELPTVLDPSVDDIFYRVESGEPPTMWWSVLGIVDNDLGIVRCSRDSSGGNDQDSEPDKLSKRCLHTD